MDQGMTVFMYILIVIVCRSQSTSQLPVINVFWQMCKCAHSDMIV